MRLYLINYFFKCDIVLCRVNPQTTWQSLTSNVLSLCQSVILFGFNDKIQKLTQRFNELFLHLTTKISREYDSIYGCKM